MFVVIELAYNDSGGGGIGLGPYQTQSEAQAALKDRQGSWDDWKWRNSGIMVVEVKEVN